MGKHGPQPEPVAMKLARGETRPSRVNREAPMPRLRKPSPDADMDPEAVPVWRHILREMPPGVILAADAYVLRAYCEVVAAYRRDEAMLRETGPIIRGTRGRDIVRSPLVPIVREEREAMRLLGRELGLSPAARAGLRIDPGSANLEMDDLLGPHPRLRAVPDG